MTYRAAYISDTVLTSPDQSDLDDDELITEATAELKRIGAYGKAKHQVTEGDIKIGEWTDTEVPTAEDVAALARDLMESDDRIESVESFAEHGQWWARATYREHAADEDEVTYSVVATGKGFELEVL